MFRYIKAPNAGFDDSFGRVSALSADTLAVGVCLLEDSCSTVVSAVAATDHNCAASGAVYTYTRHGNDWVSFGLYIKAPNAEAGDLFGAGSLALDGNSATRWSSESASREGSCSTEVSVQSLRRLCAVATIVIAITVSIGECLIDYVPVGGM